MTKTNRMIRRISPAALWLVLVTPACFAQGSQRVSVVQGDTGQAVAGANIWVCAGMVQPAYANTPACLPAATIYSDPKLMNPVAQPLVSDGLGNYSYFGVAGTYTEVITGPSMRAEFADGGVRRQRGKSGVSEWVDSVQQYRSVQRVDSEPGFRRDHYNRRGQHERARRACDREYVEQRRIQL
jgi:hypothetical protein